MFEQPRRLHPAAIVIKFGEYGVHTVKGMAPAFVAIVASGGRALRHEMPLIIVGFLVVTALLTLIGPVLHFLSTRFYIQSDALVISSGFVWRKRRTIPLARIQNVNLQRTIWHRILKAAAVKIETAAGKRSEGDLAALSIEDANDLQAALLQRPASQAVAAESAPKADAIYVLSLRQVFLAGMLENRVIYIIAGIFSVFQFDRTEDVMRPLVHAMNRLSPVAAIAVGALSLLGLVIVGWLVSIAMSATRFYGFRIEKHERGLLLIHGLITQFRSIVPVGRVQSVRVAQPILFRLLGYCEMYADTAGSYDRKDVAAANKVCPIVPEGSVSQIGRHLLSDFEFECLRWNEVSPRTVIRHTLRYLLLWSIILGYPLWHWLHWHAFWALIPMALACWLSGVLYYRFVGFAFTSDLLASRSGVFRIQSVIIPFDRIQHYSITRSRLQRVLGLATVTVVSASSAGHAIHIMDLPTEDAEHLRQRIGDSIIRHLGSRRAGL
ncbi:MAG TPA: PH domain-containing protein [Fimbriimonadaceae bacterium]|nr:PH domain-containing protein [Fimbriimonadaceae bacterium]